MQSTPADGAVVSGDVQLSLRFSDAFDPETCTGQTVFVAWLSDRGHANAPLPVTLAFPDADQIVLEHPPLWAGRWRLGVQTGPAGCLSQWGRSVEPFAADFQVVD